jgi:serine/threonine protein kinase
MIERIGRGGMGEVWRAADDRADADPPEVAVKVIAADRLSDPEARARFDREIAAARRVESSEVATVVGADSRGDRPWLAAEYVPGETLAEHVGANGPLADDALLTLGVGLARGLDAIHRAGVVHRDLTPGNVVLGPDGPVIVDFGVSRIDDVTTITRAGDLVGTPAWMAPEQLRDDEVSDASDVWAWGAVMAYASTGNPPVSGERTETVIARVLDGALDLDGIPDWLQPSVAGGGDPTESNPQSTASRDWSRPMIRAGVLLGAVVLGLFLPALLAVVLFTVGVLTAGGLRIWTEERRGGETPTVNAGTVFVASILLLASALSTVLGFTLAIAAVVALIALFVAVGGDIG